MKLSKKILLSPIVVLMLSSCVTRRGSVVMKTESDEAHVGIGSGEVEAGDYVVLYRNSCTGLKGNRSCKKIQTGHGIVTSVLSEDYSAVKFEPGVDFKEGDTVEKHNH